QCPDLAARLTGSGDIFDHHRRRPWASVNFVSSHDGFTLQDIVSYEGKHNEANKEDNNDGHGENFTANWGEEGPTEDPEILKTRENIKRSMLATLFFSMGTPMLLAGDEFGRTQLGNNNAYCQDNEISWVDWSLLDTDRNRDLMAFVAELARLRHRHPSLRGDKFMHGQAEIAPGVHDIDWFSEDGAAMEPANWQEPQRQTLALRRAATGPQGQVEISLLLLNASAEEKVFTLPAPERPWTVALHSAGNDRALAEDGREVTVDAQSVMLLLSQDGA
ncbi:MAG: glycogen debranching enzyme GlgX, partial [Dongiaceae bacterium]